MADNEIEIDFNGKKITYTEYKIIARKFIEKQVPDLKKLYDLWIDDSKRIKFVDMLQEMQIDLNFIKEIEKKEECDNFDVIANMVFEYPLITRNERADLYIKENIDKIIHNNEEIKDIVLSILDKYREGGIENINIRILLGGDMLQKDAYNILKANLGPENVVKLFNDIKRGIYNLKIT
ncbi:MAG: type I restriction-modification enzyme R subunit C-terminal domain-containing protein [Methanobacterium sp.]